MGYGQNRNCQIVSLSYLFTTAILFNQDTISIFRKQQIHINMRLSIPVS